jgi:hypothetical protein
VQRDFDGSIELQPPIIDRSGPSVEQPGRAKASKGDDDGGL